MTYSRMALDNDEKCDTCHFMNANADLVSYIGQVYTKLLQVDKLNGKDFNLFLLLPWIEA